MEHNKIFIYNPEFKIENAVADDNLLKIEGYFCHFNKMNLNGEVVDENSFKEFFKMYGEKKIQPALNFNHTDSLIGGIDNVTSKGDGLWLNAHLNRNVALVRDMIEPCIMAGDLNSFSSEGYIAGGWDGITELKDGGYYVKNFMLTAVAVVAVPADPDAKFSLQNFLSANKPVAPEPVKSKWYLFV